MRFKKIIAGIVASAITISSIAVVNLNASATPSNGEKILYNVELSDYYDGDGVQQPKQLTVTTTWTTMCNASVTIEDPEIMEQDNVFVKMTFSELGTTDDDYYMGAQWFNNWADKEYQFKQEFKFDVLDGAKTVYVPIKGFKLNGDNKIEGVIQSGNLSKIGIESVEIVETPKKIDKVIATVKLSHYIDSDSGLTRPAKLNVETPWTTMCLASVTVEDPSIMEQDNVFVKMTFSELGTTDDDYYIGAQWFKNWGDEAYQFEQNFQFDALDGTMTVYVPIKNFVLDKNNEISGLIQSGNLSKTGIKSVEVIAQVVEVPATDIALNESTLSLEKGEEFTLEATIKPSDSTDDVEWSSDKEDVATVDENGKVTAKDIGTATITATAGSVSATCEVTVKLSAKGISLDKTTLTLEKGDTSALVATVDPENSTDEVVWRSDKEDIATVDQSGKVTAKDIGTAKITATAGEYTAECTVTVKLSATGVSLDKTELTLEKGKTDTLTATVAPENSTDEVVWSSSDKAVATVDEKGKVTAVAAGEATITATAGKASATCKVTVKVPVDEVTLNQPSLFLIVDDTATLTATVTPEDATDKTVTWSTNDETVATVKNGVVTAVGKGEAIITAKAGDKSATCKVTVIAPAKEISLPKEGISVLVGEEKAVTITVDPEDAKISNINYTSSDEKIFTVTDGKIKGISKGTATLTVTAANEGNTKLTAECTVTVTDKVIAATAITLSETAVELEVEGTKILTATLTPADSTDKITWTSSDATIVSVDEAGKITALKVGEATITAKANETVSAQCKVTVTEKTIAITSVTLNKTSAELTEGDTLELIATVNPENTTEDKTVTWSSSDTSVATVDKDGMVTAVKEGKAVITAKAGTKTAECTITVNKKTIAITSVTLNKTSAELTVGDTLELIATVNPENTTEDKTVTWSSSDTSVATVDKDGKVTAVAAGTAIITATSNADETKKASCTVNVTEPEVTEPDVTEPDVTEPDETEPEVTELDVTEPDVTEPDVTEPEVTEPDVTEPEVTEPDVTEPEVTEPDVTEPDVTEPDVTEPDVTAPEEPAITEGSASGETEIKKDTEIKIEIPELNVTLEAKAGTFEEAVLKLIAEVEIKLANASDEEKAAVIAAAIKGLANAAESVSVNDIISITLKDQDGNIVQPVGGTAVKVTLPYDGKSNYVAYIDGDKVEFIKLTIADGFASFEAKHFSDYYLISLSDDAVKAVEGEGASTDTTTTEPGTSDDPKDDENNKPTGIAIALVPAVAAAAASIIFKKRK